MILNWFGRKQNDMFMEIKQNDYVKQIFEETQILDY